MRKLVWGGAVLIILSLLASGCVPVWLVGKEKHAEGEATTATPPVAQAAETLKLGPRRP